MANRYKFSTKKPVGNIKKFEHFSNTIFADDIKHACKNFADLIDVKILDNSYTYFLDRIDECVGDKKNYTYLKFDYNNELVETFIEKVD